MKNYIGFVNDHSGSMDKHARAAVTDYNTNITAVKDAATREMLDTVVSVVAVGIGNSGYGTERQVVVSNPHVLKPITNWPTPGGTPLYDGIADMINLFKSLPDANKEDVSFLVMITTDGEESHSRLYNEPSLAKLIAEVSASGRWTFVMRVPVNARMDRIKNLGIPLDNIQKWDTSSAAGITASTAQTTQAMDSYFATRATGVRASSAFYATAAKVDISALQDVTKDVSLYVVPDADMGIEIRDFMLRHRMEYLKGAAFYQLTKTESRVSHTKMIAIRARNTGKIFAGAEARQMIGLPTDRNARLHPGDHGEYDIFIQSESVNRKLVAGTGVLYWAKIGVPFTAADLAYLQPKPAVAAAPAPVQLPAVAATGRPTPSPIPKVRRTSGPHVKGTPARFFITRERARDHARATKKPLKDVKDYSPADLKDVPKDQRWFIFE